MQIFWHYINEFFIIIFFSNNTKKKNKYFFKNEMNWDNKTKFCDEEYFDLHWIIIRRIKRKLDSRCQCLYKKPKNIPTWFETYYQFFNGQNEIDKKAEIWSKLDEKCFQAHCLICKFHHVK